MQNNVNFNVLVCGTNYHKFGQYIEISEILCTKYTLQVVRLWHNSLICISMFPEMFHEKIENMCNFKDS